MKERKPKKSVKDKSNWIYNLTSSSFPFMGREALALALDKIIPSVSAASCMEARINSAERMLQK